LFRIHACFHTRFPKSTKKCWLINPSSTNYMVVRRVNRPSIQSILQLDRKTSKTRGFLTKNTTTHHIASDCAGTRHGRLNIVVGSGGKHLIHGISTFVPETGLHKSSCRICQELKIVACFISQQVLKSTNALHRATRNVQYTSLPLEVEHVVLLPLADVWHELDKCDTVNDIYTSSLNA
jgi:hypothetical protein